MKKAWKIFFIVFLTFILILGTCCIYFFSLYGELIMDSSKTVEINSVVYNHDFVLECKKCTVITDKKLIDTSSLGKKRITLKYKMDNQLVEEEVFEFEVIDTTVPEITYQENLSTIVGKEIDLLKDVSASDNSKEQISVVVEGEYSFQKDGTYNLSYVAVDSSGNRVKKDFILVVEKIKVVSKPATNNNSGQNASPSNDTAVSSKGYSIVTQNGNTYVDGVLIANKTYPLSSSYGNGLTNETLQAFYQMRDAAAREGLTLTIISGFRSYDRQMAIYNNYVSRDGKEKADTYSARAGHSEHQTGLAFDLNDLTTSFGNTREGQWLHHHAHEYGFILRYPNGKTNETGYVYEPWHFRYAGVELASKLYNQGNWITLEDYFGITSVYSY